MQVGAFATASRPTAATVGAGGMIFDSTLNKPVSLPAARRGETPPGLWCDMPQIITYPAPTIYPGANTWPGYTGYPDPPLPPSTRHSSHTARAWLVNQAGTVTELDEVQATLNFDEALSPFGDATVDAVLTGSDMLAASDPLSNRGLRLLLELNESTGDPVRVSEITADHTGSVAAMTAAFGPALTPAKITSTYFLPWNSDAVRPGGAIRADLIVTERDVDYAAEQATFQAATDEAALQAYKLLSTAVQTSGSLSVRDTVNYALAKVGAALLPGPDDATIAEAGAIVWTPGVSAWDYVQQRRRSGRSDHPVRRAPPLDPHRPRHRPPRVGRR